MDIDIKDIVKLSNNEEYTVEDVIIMDNNKYLLLKKNNEAKLTFVKVGIENNKYFFTDLSDSEYKKVLDKISK